MVGTLNLRILVHFHSLKLRNKKGTYSKYFENNISETDTSSADQL